MLISGGCHSAVKVPTPLASPSHPSSTAKGSQIVTSTSVSGNFIPDTAITRCLKISEMLPSHLRQE